jgi:hypothetical protein
MEFSEFKELQSDIDNIGIDTGNWREILENAGTNDFEVDDYRFILRSDIDQIQCDELKGDLYILGCFNAWFLADVLDIDCDVIEAMQEAEAYEAIGKLIISMDKLSELQQEYSSADGYGHHFNHYDGNEYELDINGFDYLVFQIN